MKKIRLVLTGLDLMYGEIQDITPVCSIPISISPQSYKRLKETISQWDITQVEIKEVKHT